MKIATFNINNIRRRLPNLLDWLREANPDAVCLQELKATDAEFPAEAIKEAGYEAIWRGQKTWNGVAILSKSKPIETLSELPGDLADTQSRYIEAAVIGIIVARSTRPTGIRSPVQNLITSSLGFAGCRPMPPSFWPRECLSCSRETITLFPLTRTSTLPSRGTRTRWFSLQAGPPLPR
jgi:hypothetical protein